MKHVRIFYILIIALIYSCSSHNEEIVSIEDNDPIEDTTEDTTEDTAEDTSNTEDQITTVDGIKIGPNYVVFEPEVTKSDLGLWAKRVPTNTEYHVVSDNEIDAINKNYLEFTGNNLNSGTPKSPLTYTFKSPKTAKYRLVMRMYQPLKDGEAADKRNDLWIKLDGDFTSACVYPTEDLKKNHKFWGRGVRKWGSSHSLEGHVNGVKKLAKVVYNLKKDESYTFTISGRAQGCSIDYILFYEENMGNVDNYNFTVINHTDIAAELPDFLRPDTN